MAGLDGPRAKLWRADAQLMKLREEVEGRWPRAKLWPVRVEPDGSGLKYDFYVVQEGLPEIRPEWGPWAGEVMFDLRCALDHLAFQLWMRRFRGVMNAEIETISQFPIYDKPDAFVNFRNRLTKVCEKQGVPTLTERDWRALCHLQPYITRHDKWYWDRNWLRDLNELHRFDKHRKLHVITGAQNSAVVYQFDPALGYRSNTTWGPLKPDGHVETWTFTQVPPEVPPHRGVFLQVSLEYGVAWAELAVMLQGMRAAVDRVLNRFADRFP
jgi:hypothetical protein